MLASRGASGIDGLVSSAIGAALAHQAAGGGPAVALLGDLAFLHDAPGLMLGPDEPRPDLCLVVVNNDGGGIFSIWSRRRSPARLSGCSAPRTGRTSAAWRMPPGFRSPGWRCPGDLAAALAGQGLRVVEVRTERAAAASLRARLRAACTAAALG